MQRTKFSIDSILSAKISDGNSKDFDSKFQYTQFSDEIPISMKDISTGYRHVESYMEEFPRRQNISCFCSMCKKLTQQADVSRHSFNDDKIFKKLRQCNDNYNITKRRRTIFSAEQLERLEYEFQQQQYLVGEERKYLARELQLNEVQIKVWYQNRRIKWRKYVKPFYETPNFSRNSNLMNGPSL